MGYGELSFVTVPVCYNIGLQNFVKIRLHFTEIWQYNNFQDGDGPPFWISKFRKFSHSSFARHYSPIFVHNCAKIGQYAADVSSKRTFSIWREPCVRHLELKNLNFDGQINFIRVAI